MRNQSSWQPSKFVFSGKGLIGSRDPAAVGIGSRLVSDVVGHCYDLYLTQYCSGRMLDLGCGEVPLYATYRDRVSEVVCADWPSSLHACAHVDVWCDLTRPLPFMEAQFDTVLLSDVLEHVPVPQALCNEIARVLAPGGCLILNVPFYYWLHEQPHDYYRYTEFALKRFMEKAGLEIVDLSPVGGVVEIVVDILAKRLARIHWVGSFLANWAQNVTSWVRRPPREQKWVSSSAGSFPLGYFLIAQKPTEQDAAR